MKRTVLRRRRAVVASSLALMAFAAAQASGPAFAAHGPQPALASSAAVPVTLSAATVRMQNVAGTPAFVPALVSITVGDQVTWVNGDSTSHSVVSGSFSSPDLPPGGRYSQVFPTAGSYSYHCGIHTFMTGTVNVS